MTGFEDLDDDVLYLVLDYLYLERTDILQSFRLTSSRLKDFAEAVAHKTVSLIDDEVHEQITYRLTERLTDPSDKLCQYVRELRVVGFKGDAHSYCLNSALFVDCLLHVHRLDAFSWICDTPPPLELLNVLQHRFPTAQVNANVKLVGQNQLSISHLHRLDVSVPCAEIVGDFNISLFRALKEALLRFHSLRHLCIDTHHEPNVGNFKGAALDRLQLPLEPGDKLPSLVSLALRSKNYDYDVDHCKNLLAALDCNKLQSLTLGAFNPISFFEEFRQRLPHLSHLEISHSSSRHDHRLHGLDACANFTAELTSLNNFVLRLDYLDFRSNFCKMLADVHGPNLLHMSLQASDPYLEGSPCRGNVRRFLWAFTKLESLSMSFPDVRSYHRCLDCEGYQWGVCTLRSISPAGPCVLNQDSAIFSFVPPLPSLRNIQLSVRAPYSDRPLSASISTHAHCAISHLWSTFANQPGSQLETLSMRFWRWQSNGRKTRLKEVTYDTTRLRGQLRVKVRQNREVPTVVYQEVWKENEDGDLSVFFEK